MKKINTHNLQETMRLLKIAHYKKNSSVPPVKKIDEQRKKIAVYKRLRLKQKGSMPVFFGVRNYRIDVVTKW